MGGVNIYSIYDSCYLRNDNIRTGRRCICGHVYRHVRGMHRHTCAVMGMDVGR